MTETPHLGLPFIDAGQAQKHVTHNEALRILDAAIQIAVQDISRSTPPADPAEGQRHVVAAGAGGGWAGQAQAIASWQDGAWAFLPAKAGWCVWSAADGGMMVFDGAAWRPLGLPSLDSVPHLGINTAADGNNLLSVRSNAALLSAIDAASGGSGDVRLQLSKQSAQNTASVVFSDNYSGRAEFGLVGSDAFKLKVSADGASFIEALVIDPASGNAVLPRGLALSGVIAPPPITADQNDYNPAGIGSAAVLQLSSEAPRSLSGLAGGAEGRIVVLINVGGHALTLLDDSAASAAANRFAFGGALSLAARQAALLRYDGTAARWQAIVGGNLGASAVRSVKVQKFSASGTYTPSAGLLYCIIEAQGGGGGGGGCANPPAGQNAAGAGGGSGGYSRKLASAAEIGVSKPVTIGSGGAGGVGTSSNGAPGGTTSVGSLCTAGGGMGGLSGPATFPQPGGAGGSVGIGDVALPGAGGGASVAGYVAGLGGSTAGGGGSLMLAAGAPGQTSGAQNGIAGSNGGGGSGAVSVSGLGAFTGGAGGNGIVIITEYSAQ